MNPLDAGPTALAPPRPQTAQAELEFACDANGATYVHRQRVGYPFHVGRSLKMPGDPPGMPTVYLQSCSGGIFEGDTLRLRIAAGEGAAAHVATAASTVVHSMASQAASQQVELHAQAGSYLEYLPDPVILFPRAKLTSGVRVSVHPGATVILGDSVLLHDPKGGDGRFDWLQSETGIEDAAGKLLVRDRFRIEGVQLARGLAGITGHWKAQGNLFVVTTAKPPAELVAAMRAALASAGVYAGATILPNQSGAWARILATDAAALKAALFSAWTAVRQTLTGAVPMPRRK
ncbi:MAG: urease accessory protein UreD [Betaproteobacteria bacterium]|nr:urease accessory protein UreD [Betaproteobacteria bacterium]